MSHYYKPLRGHKTLPYLALLNVAMNMIIIPRYSFVGAAWTTLATEIFIFAVSVVLVWKYLCPVFNLAVLSRITLFAACMTAFLYTTTTAGMWIQMIAYSLTLPFASTMVFAACMNNTAVPGTTFRKHLEIAKGLLQEDM